ncbi:hypothetical protein SteCoe_1128 [Stentor coeruleus]|uniref:Uncharacterized protein n=1 Tax=Stentor coeruleus TaxID=5963 RepID=A0A1R2D2T7_9CILI|nr:hypothetical protein SteCoe_1128 [Stentor coeruleus]
MGNCCKIKTVPYKYSEHDDGSTHRTDGIVLRSDDVITSLSSYSNTWALSQDFCISLYSDFVLTSSYTTSERVRCLKLIDNSLIYCGKNVTILNLSGSDRGKMQGHERSINSIDLNANTLVTGSADWSLRLWDLEKCEEICKSVINWNVVTSLKYSNNEIIQTSEDLRLRIWDSRDFKLAISSICNVGDNFANCCDVKDYYIATGHRGFGGNGCDVKLWDMRKLQTSIAEMKGHDEAVESVKFIGRHLISCGKDGKLLNFNLDAQLKNSWEHKNKKPFSVMETFKQGILAGSVEPRVYFFSVNPFVHEA